MQILLSKPEYERFIEEQVNGGRFASAAEVVEAALSKLMEGDKGEELDDETYEKILRANDQIDRGEGRSLEDVAIEEDERRRSDRAAESTLVSRLNDSGSVEMNKADWARMREEFSRRVPPAMPGAI